MRAQIRMVLSQPLCCSYRMSVWLCGHAYNIRKWYIYFILVRTYIMWYHHHTLQDVVNDPKMSDAIAKSVDSSKNRYLNTHTCEMSCAYVIILYICISRHIPWYVVHTHTYTDWVVLVYHIIINWSNTVEAVHTFSPMWWAWIVMCLLFAVAVSVTVCNEMYVCIYTH